MLRVPALLLAGLLFPAGAFAQDDPCADPARVEPAYCAPGIEVTLGEAGGAFVRYQLYAFYEWLPGDLRTPTHVLDAEAPYSQSAIRLYDGNDRLIWTLERDVGEAWIEAPYLVRHATYGTFLVVPVHFLGAGSGPDDRLFLWRAGAWQEIDASPRDRLTGRPGWLDAAEALLPSGQRLLRAPRIDVATMTATGEVWLPSDRACCPTGGTVTLRFRIEADALTVEGVD